MITLQISTRMPEIAELLFDRGWLEAETDDLDVIGKALSAALAAWLADPDRMGAGCPSVAGGRDR
jgi:hypothetical protein